MKGSQSRRCSIASSTLLVLVLAGCCFCSPTRPLRVGSAENTTGDQKEPKKLLKDYWWANPCAVPGGGDREIAPMSSSEEDEMVEMGIDPNLTDKWAIQLKTAILHIRKIEIRYKEHFILNDIDDLFKFLQKEIDGDMDNKDEHLVLNETEAILEFLKKEIEWEIEKIQQHFTEEDFATTTWLPTITKDYKIAKSKTIKAVTELYKGLQRFAVTIECMMGQSGCKHIFDTPKKRKTQQHQKQIHHRLENHQNSFNRMALLEEIKAQLSTLLCEVQYFLRIVKKGKLPVPPKSSIIKEWITSSSETGQMVQDLGILFKYKNYLLKWEKFTNNLLKSVDPAMRKKSKRQQRKLEQRKRRNNGGGQSRASQSNGNRQRQARRNPPPEHV